MAAGKSTRRKPRVRAQRARRLSRVRGALWTNLPAIAPESLSGLRADVKQARAEYRLGHWEDAERVLVRPLRALPAMAREGAADRPKAGATWASAWSVLARTREKLGYPRQAHEAFERAAGLFAQHLAAFADASGEEWLDYGVALEHLDAHDEALKAFEHAEKLGLRTAETYRHMGFALRERDPMEAERCFRLSRELAPEDPYALQVLAEHLAEDRPDEAGNLFRDAAFASGTRGEIDEALELFDLALQLLPDDSNALAGKAEMWRLLDECDKALPLFEKSLNLAPDIPWVMAGEGAAKHRLGDNEGALEILDATLRLAPDFLFAIGTKGRVLRELERLEESAQLLQTVRVSDPSAAWILVELAETERQRGDDRRALDALNRALNLVPRDAAARATRAAVHLGLGDQTKALSDIERSLELHEESAFAHAVHGQILYNEGLYGAAVRAMRRASDLAPEEPRYATLLGEALRLTDELEEAVQTLDRALTLDGGFAPAHASLGAALATLQRYDQALDALDEALRLEDGHYPFALSVKGRVLRDVNQLDEAEKCFRRSIELEPRQPLVLADLAELVRLGGSSGEALELSKQALGLEPELVPALVTQAHALRAEGRHAEAVEPLKKAIELDPDDAWTLADLGDTLLMEGDADGALEVLDKALELAPDHVFALATKGQALRLLGMLDESIVCLRSALAYADDAGWIHAELGEALRLSNRDAEALREFDRALELDEDNPWALAGRASVLRTMQRYPEALELLDRALALGRMSFALTAKALVLIDIGRYQEAIELLDEVVELDPPDGWICRLKGWAAELIRDGQLALAAYEAARELETGSLWADRGVAEARLLLDDRDAALDGFRRIVEHASSSETVDPSEMTLVGWAYLRLAQLDDEESEVRYELAVRYLGNALAFEEDVVPVQLDIALAQMSSGDYRRGCQAYMRGIAAAQELSPLRRHAVLEVARDDLRGTQELVPELADVGEVDSTIVALEEAMARSKAEAEEETAAEAEEGALAEAEDAAEASP
jgi:tetratricopeptide (TPR) repeat protein